MANSSWGSWHTYRVLLSDYDDVLILFLHACRKHASANECVRHRESVLLVMFSVRTQLDLMTKL